MLTEQQLQNELAKFFQESAKITHRFVVRDGDRIRMGAYDAEECWYAEVSNFQRAPTPQGVDYCDADRHVEGLFRFYCGMEVDADEIQSFMSEAEGHAKEAMGVFLAQLSSRT